MTLEEIRIALDELLIDGEIVARCTQCKRLLSLTDALSSQCPACGPVDRSSLRYTAREYRGHDVQD